MPCKCYANIIPLSLNDVKKRLSDRGGRPDMRAVIIEDNQVFAEQFCEGLLKQCRERKLELEAEVLQEKELEEVRNLRRLYDILKRTADFKVWDTQEKPVTTKREKKCLS